MIRMRRPRYYVTTPIYYVNDVPHIGHAYTTIAADAMARYKRLCGYETIFLTGTDEHGQKVEKAAAAAGESPQALADRMVQRFQTLWQQLNISHTDFIRTTEPRHQAAVTALFKKLESRGDIYKGEYEDWYCVPCETFLTELQLVNNTCPTCGRPVEKIKEESYFFAMSKYQDQLLRWISQHPKMIQPDSRRNEIVSFISGGLKDLSISRTGFSWGIPLPNDPKHIAYVWFDALVNYLTVVGYPNNIQRVRRFWPADLHLIGKDILRFHAVYWPAFLLAAQLPLPRQIFSHGWWTVNGEKMSKSKGNVVDPFAIVDSYGTDAFRYFLLREVPFGQDGDFSERALRQRYNSDLANDLGNLCFRTFSMIDRYAGGRIPPRTSSAKMKEDDPLHKAVAGLSGKIGAAMGELAFHRALQVIWEVVETANRYIEITAPWNLDKQIKKKQRLSTVLYNLAESLHLVSLYLYPFMPQTSEQILIQLGIKPSFQTWKLAKTARVGALRPGTAVKKTEPLFPRLEPTEEELAAEEAARQRQAAGRGKPAGRGDKPSQQDQQGPKQQKQQMGQQPAGGQAPGQVTIGDFSRMDLRTARILAAERIPNSQKLLKLRVSLGAEERQIVAGIGTKYEPDQLIGKQVVVIANLRPAKLMGVESQGMVLAAGDAAVASLITPLEEVPEGMKVK
jgi:methionyl-tRNA synthetase